MVVILEERVQMLGVVGDGHGLAVRGSGAVQLLAGRPQHDTVIMTVRRGTVTHFEGVDGVLGRMKSSLEVFSLIVD